jgi:FMN reductase
MKTELAPNDRRSLPMVATVSGSPVESSRTFLLGAWSRAWLEDRGFAVEAIDVRDLPPAAIVYGRVDHPSVRNAVDVVARAHGVIVATPVYKAAYSGLLKLFLDLLPQFGLSGKVVLPLAVGGTLAHVLAIDYALRPVLSSLGAAHVTGGLFLLDPQLQRAEDGRLVIERQAEERLEGVLQVFAESIRRHRAGERPADDPQGRTPVAMRR